MRFIDQYFIVKKAERLAKDLHIGQKYADNLDYFKYHIEPVVEQITYNNKDPSPELIATAYLHDVLEDTDYLPASIGEYVSPIVLKNIQALTIPKTGGNRIKRFDSKLDELVSNPDALEVRLADRLINMDACILYPGDSKKTKMYKKEYEHFGKLREFTKDVRYDKYWEVMDLIFGMMDR